MSRLTSGRRTSGQRVWQRQTIGEEAAAANANPTGFIAIPGLALRLSSHHHRLSPQLRPHQRHRLHQQVRQCQCQCPRQCSCQCPRLRQCLFPRQCRCQCPDQCPRQCSRQCQRPCQCSCLRRCLRQCPCQCRCLCPLECPRPCPDQRQCHCPHQCPCPCQCLHQCLCRPLHRLDDHLEDRDLHTGCTCTWYVEAAKGCGPSIETGHSGSVWSESAIASTPQDDSYYST
ncbi:hypothetical protein Bbelb_233600 [Branchiostoma belcheri]|nr:hypothetical protein Bbelb_233600 [Branchiostoma belcheri]